MFMAPAHAQETQPGVDLETQGEVGVISEHTDVFPPFDTSTYASQILWLAITFGLFYLFLQRVVLPRIGSILEVRRDRIAQDLDQAAQMKEEADAAIAAYEQDLTEARAKAQQIGQTARDSANAKADTERRRVEAELDAKLDEAESRIASIRDGAMRDVDTIAAETAEAIIEQLSGVRPDDAEVAAAVKAVGK